jgi:casein kinase 1
MIAIMESIHNRNVIHRDLKPENILLGRTDNEAHMIYLVDFGISKVFRDNQGRHISFKENKPFIGTTRYASIAAHNGNELGRKDDLESLGYVLIFLLKGVLPWQNL